MNNTFLILIIMFIFNSIYSTEIRFYRIFENENYIDCNINNMENEDKDYEQNVPEFDYLFYNTSNIDEFINKIKRKYKLTRLLLATQLVEENIEICFLIFEFKHSKNNILNFQFCFDKNQITIDDIDLEEGKLLINDSYIEKKNKRDYELFMKYYNITVKSKPKYHLFKLRKEPIKCK